MGDSQSINAVRVSLVEDIEREWMTYQELNANRRQWTDPDVVLICTGTVLVVGVVVAVVSIKVIVVVGVVGCVGGAWVYFFGEPQRPKQEMNLLTDEWEGGGEILS
jgi:Flp pilus assembly protein TadB